MQQRQLWIAVSLILVEAGVFAYFTDTWTIPVCAVLLSLGALLTDFRLPLVPQRRFVAAMALAIPFTIQWAFAPYEPSHLRTFILYSLAHAGGQYGLALQTAYVWTRRNGELWSAAFPVCGVCVLMAAGDVQTNHLQNIIFQAFVLAFVILTAVYFSWARIALPHHRPRPWGGRLMLSGLAVGLTCAASIVGSQLLERSWSTIERIYTEWMLTGGQEGAAGFSRQARLGSISDRPGALDQVPVLRVYSKEEPGYLRGAAFDRYRGSNWLNDAPRFDLASDPQAPVDVRQAAEFPVFRLPGAMSEMTASDSTLRRSWQMLDVWPAGTLSDAVFVPLEANWVALGQQTLTVDPHGIVYPEELLPQANYRSFVSQAQHDAAAGSSMIPTQGHGVGQLDVETRTRLIAVPEDLDPRLRELANTILKDCETDEQKVFAISGWFHKNYHYELGMQVPAGHDPLVHFLLRRPPAHCEYFSTGTAILLRLGQVPCRYVTGFVSTEYNYLGGYWLARNKDAHAWVEAWLPGRGWVVVESTPAAGIPHSNPSVQTRHLWDDMVLRVQMLRSQLMRGTWRGLWHAAKIILAMLFTTPHGWLMLCGLVIWGIVLFRRHFQFSFGPRLDPVTIQYRMLLRDLDRAVAKQDEVRQPHETLHQFATRLEQSQVEPLHAAAHWYRSYAESRYQGQSTPDEVINLRTK